MTAMTQREMDRNNEIDAARMTDPCGCPECDEGVQPGHFACEQSEQWLLEAEQRGEVFRAYDSGWHWYIVVR